MNTIDSVSNINTAHNLQFVNNASGTTHSKAIDNVANPILFSSYIEQALAQVGIANPTNVTDSTVVLNANRVNSAEKSLSTFIQELFVILGKEDAAKQAKPTTFNQHHTLHAHHPLHGSIEEAMAAYSAASSTTIGNIVENLQTLLQHVNDKTNNVDNTNQSLQDLQDSIQNIFGNASNNATLTNFLDALIQNLKGQNPLGIIINTQA